MKKVPGADYWKMPNRIWQLILWSILPELGFAQLPNPQFINFTNKEGLSANSINAICKDKYGYMWFATEDGLNRFDGANFSVYRHDPSDSASIGGNDITALYRDRRGNMWVGTNQSLSLYNPERDAFINYHFMGNNAIRAICEDHAGDLWVGGYNGLFRFDEVTGKVKNFQTSARKPGQLLSNTVLCLFQDSRQRLWIGTNNGLNLYVPGRSDFLSFTHSRIDSNSIADSIVRCVAEDQAGNIWFGTDNGLSRLRADGKSFTNYKRRKAGPGSLLSNCIYAVRVDRSGRLWIGTEEGLNIFDPLSGNSQGIVRDHRNKYSLVGNSIRALFIDGNGLYWIGTIQGGVSKYDENLTFFNYRGSNPLDPGGLSCPIVTSFAEASSGDIYVGTDGGGLNLYHRRTGLFGHPALTHDGSRPVSILGMERVGDELWLGTWRQGVFVLDTRSGHVRHYTQGTGASGLSGNEVFCVKKDSRGNMWIGTNGNGVDVLGPGSDTFRRPVRLGQGHDGNILTTGFIRAIEEDHDGNMWIASNGGGIAIYDVKRQLSRVLDHDNSNLPSNVVLSLHLDRNGNIWAGSKGGGLSLYTPALGRFISFSEPQGLSNAVIYKILEDSIGKLWLSTNKGISSFDPLTRRFKNYSYQNGLQRSTFSLGAGLQTSAGDFFFGGMDGFNYFDPYTLHSNKSVPSLQFTALRIANRKVIPGPEEPIKEHISDAKEIRLDFKQNFSIDFIALNYTTPQDCRYTYKLEGFDKDWNLVGNSHTAIYTNLDPGEYTFHAKATSDDGSWSTPEKMIRIMVRPPFWRTRVAYALYALMAVLLLLLLRYIGIRRWKNKFALEQERMRTRQMIEQERKESERQHEFDELKIKFLTNLSHEFRTPVSLIVGPIDRLLDQEQNGERINQLSMVKRNANRIFNLVNQLLDFRKLEENELKLNLTEGDIISFIREIAGSFGDIAAAKQIDFTFSSSIVSYYTRFDRDKIDRVLLNLLSNAFKFTPREGKITLGLEKPVGSEIMKIWVSDSGIGMTADVQEKIFNRFFQAGQNKDVLNQGSGIGLSIASEFIKLHGGAISVESISGKGSTFTVLLPCAAVAEPAVSAEPPVIPVRQPSSPDTAQPARAFRNATVLLIEDDDDFRQYLRDNLKPFYRIVEASNGKEGWQRALSSHPQVVVSDINMPFMDGITLSRKLSSDKRTRHIPVILLTAVTGDANRLMGLQTGAHDYLTKPFNFEILNQKIKNLISFNQTVKSTFTRQLKVVPSDVETSSEDEKVLARITQYIDSHLDSSDLSVEDLSRHLFMSRGSLYNKIVELTGETPVEFIRSIKLTKGALLLEKSDMKIAQIGYAVGFSSPNYFAKAFKAKFNLSPTEYAQQKKASQDRKMRDPIPFKSTPKPI